MRSSEHATAHGERRKRRASAPGSAFFAFALRRRVTCIVQVSVLRSLVTCKMQVTKRSIPADQERTHHGQYRSSQRRSPQPTSVFRNGHSHRRLLFGLVGARFYSWRARSVRREAWRTAHRTTARTPRSSDSFFCSPTSP